MIKYAVIPEKKIVYAILSNTRHDALRKIEKMMGDDSVFCAWSKKYMMPNTFRAKATCDDRDEWNEEVGKEVAKAKVLKNYYRSLDKRIDMFRADLIELNGRVFETPAEFSENA